jgi:hypothetical protein
MKAEGRREQAHKRYLRHWAGLAAISVGALACLVDERNTREDRMGRSEGLPLRGEPLLGLLGPIPLWKAARDEAARGTSEGLPFLSYRGPNRETESQGEFDSNLVYASAFAYRVVIGNGEPGKVTELSGRGLVYRDWRAATN